MNHHPSNPKLEGHAAGDADPEVVAHLIDCTACRSYVERSRAAAAVPLPEALLARALASSSREDRATPADRSKTARVVRIAFGVAAPLAAAAAIAVFVHRPAPDVGEQAETSEGMRFKGGLQLAAIRDRAGAQERFATSVTVRAGDRLRLEVVVDRERPVTAGILGQDGSWLTVLAPALLGPGTHLSERAAAVDALPIGGAIVAGDPDDVAQARRTQNFLKVAVLPVHPE
jgi:hypothetical protein